MLKILTLVCALLGLLICVITEAWVRSRILGSETAEETAVRLHDRSAKFWSTQYIPVILSTVVIAVAVGLTIERICAAVYLIGAAVSFISVFIGTGSFRSGNTAAVSQAEDKNMKIALRAGYRSASVMGLITTCLGLLALGIVYMFFKTDKIPQAASCLALGASVTALFMRLSGAVYSGAYVIAAREKDYADYSGSFAANGSDWIETYLVTAAASAVLAEVGVSTSGVTSTFTQSTAAKFPLLIYAFGIIASLAGTLFFRTSLKKNPSKGLTIGTFISGIAVAGISVYFSNSMLQSYVYAYCIALGIAAGLITGELNKAYTADSRIFRRQPQSERSLRNGQSVIASLAAGLTSVLIPTVFIITAAAISNQFAGYYGIALSAVGMSSIACINATLRGYAVNTKSTSEIIASSVDEDMSTFSDILYSTGTRAESAGKTYSAVSGMLSAIALITAFVFAADMQSVDMTRMSVLCGSAAGVVLAFIYAGLVFEAVRVTTKVIQEKYNYSEDSSAIHSLRGVIVPCFIAILIPVLIGLGGGIYSLAGFLISFVLTGSVLVFAFNNSGRYFENTATETLTTLIKLTTIISIVFIPVFKEVGGLFF